MRVTLLTCTFSVVHNTYNFSSCKTRLKHFHSIFSGCFKSLPEKGRACTEIRTTASTSRLPAKTWKFKICRIRPCQRARRACRSVVQREGCVPCTRGLLPNSVSMHDRFCFAGCALPSFPFSRKPSRCLQLLKITRSHNNYRVRNVHILGCPLKNYDNPQNPKNKVFWMMNLKTITFWKITPFVKITPRNFL